MKFPLGALCAVLFASSIVACSSQSSLPSASNGSRTQSSSNTSGAETSYTTKGQAAPYLTCTGCSPTGSGSDPGAGGSGGSGSSGTGNGNCRLIAKRDVEEGCGTGGGAGGVSRNGSGEATVPPHAGLSCAGSPIVLGTDNLPGNTSGAATTVVNITSIENGNSQVAGWLYETENGNFFLQGNRNMPSVIALFGSFLGGFSEAFLNAIDTPQHVTSSQLQSVVSAERKGDFTSHDCFTTSLNI